MRVIISFLWLKNVINLAGCELYTVMTSCGKNDFMYLVCIHRILKKHLYQLSRLCFALCLIRIMHGSIKMKLKSLDNSVFYLNQLDFILVILTSCICPNCLYHMVSIIFLDHNFGISIIKVWLLNLDPQIMWKMNFVRQRRLRKEYVTP